jgi:hypothetical protein
MIGKYYTFLLCWQITMMKQILFFAWPTMESGMWLHLSVGSSPIQEPQGGIIIGLGPEQ